MNPNKGRKSATTPQNSHQQSQSSSARGNAIQNVGRNTSAANPQSVQQQPTRQSISGQQPQQPQSSVRGHLLNQHLGGPSMEQNLFASSANANTQHAMRMESEVKNLLGKSAGQHVTYRVDASGGSAVSQQRGDASSFSQVANVGRNAFNDKKT